MSYVSESELVVCLRILDCKMRCLKGRTLGGNDLSSPSSAPSSWDRLRPTVVTDWFWAIVNFIVLLYALLLFDACGVVLALVVV